jgi:hypothetical protein
MNKPFTPGADAAESFRENESLVWESLSLPQSDAARFIGMNHYD